MNKDTLMHRNPEQQIIISRIMTISLLTKKRMDTLVQ